MGFVFTTRSQSVDMCLLSFSLLISFITDKSRSHSHDDVMSVPQIFHMFFVYIITLLDQVFMSLRGAFHLGIFVPSFLYFFNNYNANFKYCHL